MRHRPVTPPLHTPHKSNNALPSQWLAQSINYASPPHPQLSHSRHNTRNTSPSRPTLPGRIRCRLLGSRVGREGNRNLLGPSRCRWDNHQPLCRRGRCRRRSTLLSLESSAPSTCHNSSKPRRSIHIERGAKERRPLREREELTTEWDSSHRGIRRKCYA